MLEQFGLSPTNAKSVVPGDRFGRLTVLATGQKPGTYRYMAVCQCDCGSSPKPIRMDGLINGVVMSCGCYRLEVTTTHGLTSSPHFGRWRNMMDRCYRPACKAYPDYGERGIKVCDAWHDPSTYIAQLPAGYFEGAELDRIDNDGDYEPGNVRWVTRKKNAGNRRSRREIEYLGVTKSLREWSHEVGLDERLIHNRLDGLGWSVERALTEPPSPAAANMARARQARWGGHEKRPQPPARVLARYEFEGESLTIAEIAARCGVSAKLLRKRICERNWPIERATTTPP